MTCTCSAQVSALRAEVVEQGMLLREALSLLRQRGPAHPGPERRAGYPQLVERLRARVTTHTPRGARVLVVSRGDAELLAVPDRTAGHFPQTPDGAYAGHHPADSDSAVAHLDQLRADGWRYLVFPSTALWWLDHYTGLRRHLETHGHLLSRADDVGVVYGLVPLDPAQEPAP